MSDDLDRRIDAALAARANKPAAATPAAPTPAPQPADDFSATFRHYMQFKMLQEMGGEQSKAYVPPPGSPGGAPVTYDETNPASLLKLDRAGVEALMKAGKLRAAGDALSNALGGRGLFRRSSDR